MNRMFYQNQGSQTCASRNQESGCCPSNMQGNMQRQMRNTVNTPGTCKQQPERTACSERCPDNWRQNVPTGNRRQLLSYINEVSFGAYEALLFLDTHPDCMEAMQYFQEHNEKRNFALKEYARLYGPLNLANIDSDCEMSWEWVNQPWPWEGGNC